MSLTAYLRFWWRSTNEHGVHSPFVFDLVTKCFYDKTKYEAYNTFSKLPIKGFSAKDKAFLYRVFQYFSYQNVHTFEENSEILDFYTALFSVNTEKKEIDIFVFNQNKPVLISDIRSKMHNDSLLLICRPYENTEKENFWKEIVESNAFSVTIDTYRFGLSFVRKEQLKQHFVIHL